MTMKRVILLLALMLAVTLAAASVVQNGNGTVTISYTMPNAQAARLRDALCNRVSANPCTLAAANGALKDLLISITTDYELGQGIAAAETTAANTPKIDPGN
jgi:hypothetical protein